MTMFILSIYIAGKGVKNVVADEVLSSDLSEFAGLSLNFNF